MRVAAQGKLRAKGALGRLRRWNENEEGELFYKSIRQLKGPRGSRRAAGMNFAIIAKFMPAPTSILQNNKKKINLDKLK